MSVREYIGARYVPLFADPIDWDSTKTYEPLTVVYNQGNSYTSRQYVPAGIDISNDTYWARTGNYNAQIEQYRSEVATFDDRITTNETAIANEVTRATAAEKVSADAIANEVTRAKEAEQINADAIANEVTRAKEAEQTNADAIANEVTRAKEAEQTNATAIEGINGDNWVTKNRINDNAVTTDKIADGAVTTSKLGNDIQANLKKLETQQINFKCVDRFIVGTQNSINASAQAGCAFIQDGITYFAQFIHAIDMANDKLIIRNLNVGTTVATFTANFDHGYSLSYNPDTKKLITHNDNNKLILIDVSTIGNPSISGYIDLSLFGISSADGSMFCWYGDDIALLKWSDKTISILNTENYTVETHLMTFDNSATPQNINYDAGSGAFYIGCSSPNCIIVIDGETYTQQNAISMNDFYGCIFLQELESANRLDNTIYFNNYETVDTLLVVSIFACNLEKGSITGDFFPTMQDTGNTAFIIDYDNGLLIPNAFNPIFKLAGDAIKAAQSIAAYGRIFLNFKSNYPLEFDIIGAEVGVQRLAGVTSDIELKSISVNNGDLYIVPFGLKFNPTAKHNSGGTIYNCAIDAYMSMVRWHWKDPLVLTDTDNYAHPVMFCLEVSEMNALRCESKMSYMLLTSVLYANSKSMVDALVNYRSIVNTAS